MQFIYVLPGWESSAQDSRILRDAIARRNGLRVPRGKLSMKKTIEQLYIYLKFLFDD